MITTKDLRSLK